MKTDRGRELAVQQVQDEQPAYRRIAQAAETPPEQLWRAPHFDWEFNVIDEPGVINAYCLPGGKIAVYTGLFPVSRDEAGLAIVMGHEVAHALMRHHGERLADQMAVATTTTIGGAVLGAIIGGDPTPNDALFRTFVVSGGEVAVTYSDVGVLADFNSPVTAIVSLVPANAAGNRTANTPVAEARILIGALDSASILPHQTTAIADGVDRAIVTEINSVRDNYGHRVPDGARLTITAGRWYRRSSGNWHNGSAGGTMSVVTGLPRSVTAAPGVTSGDRACSVA